MVITKHYLLPERYASGFARATSETGRTISLEDFAIAIETDDIKIFPDYDTFNAAWAGAWQAFFDEYEGKPITQKDVFEYCHKLTRLFGINP